MEVNVLDDQSDVEIDVRALDVLVELVLEAESVRCDELSVHFVSKEKITELHGEFFDDPTPTDCITFPIDSPHSATTEPDEDEPYVYLGDVFICPKVALEQSTAFETEASEELTLYLVHTLLHLVGYEDTDPASEEEMRLAESRHMHRLKEAGAVLRINYQSDYH